MHEYKNNQDVIKKISFTVSSISFISLILYVLYVLENCNVYEKVSNNILFSICYYIFLFTILIYIVTKGFKLIFRYFSPFGKIEELTKEEHKRFGRGIIGLIVIMFIVGDMLKFNNIESEYLKIIVKSCYATIFVFISARYAEMIKDRGKK